MMVGHWRLSDLFAGFVLLVSLSCGVGKVTGHVIPAAKNEPSPVMLCNRLSHVYIVGVEGVGHHGVSPAIATIARTCNQHVLYEMKQLRIDKLHKSAASLRAHLSRLRSTQYPSRDVVIIEDASFPSGGNHRNTTHMKKTGGRYDLEWEHNALLSNISNAKVKYLYLNRDFYRAVASHPEFDGGFQRHAQVLHSFMWHINSEYEKINRKHPNIWRQISYEWFTNMDTYNCTAVVSAVIDFMQWDGCDVEFACKTLQSVVRSERKKTIIPDDLAYSQQFNVSLPIPVLDISPNRTYNFTTAVSARKRIVIVADPEVDQVVQSSVAQPFAVQNMNIRSRSGRTKEPPKQAPTCVPEEEI